MISLKTRKGQITAFIIIGVILLFAAALILYVQSKLAEDVNDDPQLPQAPTKIEPIVEFTTKCLTSISREGLEKIGLHGGYTSIPQYGLRADSYKPTESDALNVAEGTGFEVAYWWYMPTSNECEQCSYSTQKPPLYKQPGAIRDTSIESQINKYVVDNIGSCLQEFKEFENEFQITTKGTPLVDTKITEDNVVINMVYPLHIKAQTDEFDFKDYRATHDLDFKHIYEAAANVVETQSMFNMFELNTMNWIQAASYPSPSSDRMPPVFGQDSEAGPGTIWVKTEIEQNKLIPLLQSQVSTMQFYGSLNYDPPDYDNKFAEALYSQAIMPTNATKMDGLTARAAYLGWPIYFDISPRAGELLGNVDLSINLLFFSWSQHWYEYSYQISYPMLVELHDPDAFNGEGYTFNFAVESNIRNNHPVTSGPVDLTSTIALEDSSFCAPEFRLSGDVLIKARDSMTGEQLEDVNVLFCIPDADGRCVETCSLGATKTMSPPKLTTKLPLGYGLVKVSKEGYHAETLAHVSRRGVEGEMEFLLDPMVSVELNVEKLLIGKDYLNFGSYQWTSLDRYIGIEPNDEIIITMERVTNLEDAHVVFVRLDENNPTATVDLIPGDYKIDAMVIDHDRLIIPKDRQCKRPCFVCAKKCVDIPEVVLDTVPKGGVLISDETGGFFRVGKNDLKDNDEITIKVINIIPELMRKHDDLKQLGKVEEYSKTYRSRLLPEWS